MEDFEEQPNHVPGSGGQLMFFEDNEEETEHRKLQEHITVSVTDCRKEGSDWAYDIEVIVNGKQVSMQRMYKDVQWLHRALQRNADLGGYIIPPLPPLPSSITELPATAVIAKGDAMFGGLSRRHTLRMEMFLKALADHRFFSENHIAYNFLTNETLSNHERLGAGTMWSQISKAYSSFSLSGIQDPDEKFDSFLKYVTEAGPKLEIAYENLSEYICCWQRLGNNYILTKAAMQDVATCDRQHKGLAHYESQMAEGLFDVGVGECLLSLDAALSLALVLSYEGSYFAHCKEMLQRRLMALQAFLSTNQQLDKAKPEKKEAAEKAKDKAEMLFNSVTEVAEKEMELFSEQYRTTLKQGLLSYTEAQVAHSKRTLESLINMRNAILNPSTTSQ